MAAVSAASAVTTPGREWVNPPYPITPSTTASRK